MDKSCLKRSNTTTTSCTTRCSSPGKCHDYELMLQSVSLVYRGADDAVATWLDGPPMRACLDLFREFCAGEASSYVFGREAEGAPSQPWRWEEPGQLEPWAANKTAGRSPLIWPRNT